MKPGDRIRRRYAPRGVLIVRSEPDEHETVEVEYEGRIFRVFVWAYVEAEGFTWNRHK